MKGWESIQVGRTCAVPECGETAVVWLPTTPGGADLEGWCREHNPEKELHEADLVQAFPREDQGVQP